MYIVNNSYTVIINADFVEKFTIAENEDCVIVRAGHSDGTPPTTMGRYSDIKEARQALGELLDALANGLSIFHMPDSPTYYEQRKIKDARTRRKGGS